MSNFPLRYRLSWLPKLLKPSLGGDRRGLLPAEAVLLSPFPAAAARLVFLGDISAVANPRAPEVDERLRLLIASADLVVGNCEAPVVGRVRRPFRTVAGTHHAMSAAFLSDALGAAGIDRRRMVLSLANNHMLDQGIDGFMETQASLAGMGIETIGAAEDGLVRGRAVGGLTIGLAAFSEWRNASRQDFAGRVTMLDDLALDDFAALRSSLADLTCVVAHWDWEFRHFPRPSTRALAQSLADNGTGLVVGHHAHVLQPAERLGRTLVAYGLGDFLGTALARQPWPGRLGAIFVADISADEGSKGQVAAYRMVPFMRLRAGGSERLVSLDDLAGPLGERTRRRFAAIFPEQVE
jgi:poly-gamma-glutamate capsule biosynthesis protein CapA/YwtB (metallophosphatase superfamily)